MLLTGARDSIWNGKIENVEQPKRLPGRSGGTYEMGNSKMTMTRFCRGTFLAGCATIISLVLSWSAPAFAQSGSDSAQANNPLANFTAFNIQNYYIDEFTGPGNNDGNQFVLRYAKPLQIGNTNWLLRASLPFNSFPVGPGGSTEDGIGDLDIFAAYLFDTGDPAISFGFGPQIVVPIGDDDVATDQWQAGFANVFFDGRSPKFQYGYLLTWRYGVGSLDGNERANVAAFQPFAFYQLGDGWYTGGAPIWSANLANGDHSVPLGIRIGKVFKRGNTVFNLFAEPQWSVSDSGVGQPKQQIYVALNMQFK